MKLKLGRFLILLFVVISPLASCPSTALAQRIYDKEKDDQAQQAAKLASEISSSSVFEKQLNNLKLITKQDFATYFMAAKRQMNLDINSFIEWSDVADAVSNVRLESARKTLMKGRVSMKSELIQKSEVRPRRRSSRNCSRSDPSPCRASRDRSDRRGRSTET